MSTWEYAVLDQDGNQMGLPARSFKDPTAAYAFIDSLEQAQQRAIKAGHAALVVLNSGVDLNTQQHAEIENSITLGKQAEMASYRMMKREVGQWQTI